MAVDDFPLASLLDQYRGTPPQNLLRRASWCGERSHDIVGGYSSRGSIDLDFDVSSGQISCQTGIHPGLSDASLLFEGIGSLQHSSSSGKGRVPLCKELYPAIHVPIIERRKVGFNGGCDVIHIGRKGRNC